MEIKMMDLQARGDERGSLVALEYGVNIPFTIKRVYYLFETKAGISRGYHAHKKLKQLIIPVRGKCRFILDDGHSRVEKMLSDPTKGMLVTGLIWREMHEFSDDCVLLVLADEIYDENDYIRDYDQFIELVSENGKK